MERVWEKWYTDEVSQAKKTDEVSQAKFKTNIARGTTDPEMDSVTWSEFGNNTAPLAFVAHLATRWHNLDWFKIWSSGGAICIVCKVGHQAA